MHRHVVIAAVSLCAGLMAGCESDRSLPEYRGSSRSTADRHAESSPVRSPSLSQRVVRLAGQVRENLGDSVLADPVEGMRAVDTLVLRLSTRLFMVGDPAKKLAALKAHVFGEEEIAFDDDQDDVRNMFPHSVLARGRGSCLGISLLLLVVAEKLDLPLRGVLAPEHFFVRYDGDSGSVNVETIKGGECFGNDWYRERYRIREGSWYYGLNSLDRDEVMAVLHYNVGNAYRRHGATEAAVASYEKTVDVLPGFAEAWGNLGVALERLGRDTQALRAMEKAKGLDSSLENLQGNIGALRVRLAQHEKAVTNYRRALDDDPENADLHYGLAYACCRMGRYEQAVLHARRALALSPDHPDAGALLERAQSQHQAPAAP